MIRICQAPPHYHTCYNEDMKLIVGLGNPGKEYENTRHNVGYVVLDILGKLTANIEYDKNPAILVWKEERAVYSLTYSVRPELCLLLKPKLFMNNSGKALKSTVNKYKIRAQDILVIHDDLDLPLGSYKLQFGKGPRSHNGIKSIEEALSTKDFYRLRVGVDERLVSRQRVSGETYVLSNFPLPEKRVFLKAVEEGIIPVIKQWLRQHK